jgi:hypothetical protein
MTSLKAIMQSVREPKISLKANNKSNSIVITFHRDANDELLMRLGKSLPAAFDEILWTKAKSQNSIWAEFEKLSRAAYKGAWLMLFDRQYRNRVHPKVEEWFEAYKRDLDEAMPTSRRGRGRLPEAQRKWLGEEFDRIFPQCELVHHAAQDAVRSLDTPTDIRKAIWNTVYKTIQYMPKYGAIFSGEAFDKIESMRRRKSPQLHEPNSWTSRQLAIALLRLRGGYQYQTLQKHLADIRPVRRK